MYLNTSLIYDFISYQVDLLLFTLENAYYGFNEQNQQSTESTEYTFLVELNNFNI